MNITLKLSLILGILIFTSACEDDTTKATAEDNNLSKVNKNEIYKTGQITSYINYDDGFYHLGLDRNYTKNGSIVHELNKNLYWQDDADVNGTLYTQSEANSYCASLVLDNFDDWRLPTFQELSSLVDYSDPISGLNRAFENVANGYFWTDTPCPVCKEKSFAVAEKNGGYYSMDNSSEFHARCIRSDNKAVKNDFVRDDSAEVVVDNNKKLMWQDGPTLDMEKQGDFKSSIDYCKALTYDNYSDWRLPNILELRSTLDFRGIANDGALNVVFLNRQINNWSSTTTIEDTSKAWDVEYYKATSLPIDKKRNNENTRCVRSIDN